MTASGENAPQHAPDQAGNISAEERTEAGAESGEHTVVIEGVVPDGHVIVLGPDGEALGTVPATLLQQAADAASESEDQSQERHVTELVEQPAKVMRIGSMVRQLLEEVKAAPLDEASRARLRDIHQASIKELESGLAPELIEELERISLPFTEDATPSDGELRIAQAQLVGWLEGLFHGIQTAIYAQQMMSRGQVEQLRRALPGMSPQAAAEAQAQAQQQAQAAGGAEQAHGGGMYL